ncbi:uncharacterized protein LOC113468103 [Diaphorina citri]|uniref:Uncharacterized protein LOC113468103 n=1 Tax=Diaphorina citri TaxID=121845 RepID=A0A3Q0IWD0_DIACI|nr:uncharacterized protein LOC113468103 [Diaphorina citri]
MINGLKTVLSFALGLYTGTYMGQNYTDMPKVDSPQTMFEKLKKFIEDPQMPEIFKDDEKK